MVLKRLAMHALFKKYKARLKKLDTPHFCDVSEKVRVLHHHIRPLIPGLKMVGVAHTVASKGDLLAVFHALRTAKPDEILMIDANGATNALAGELIATEAKRRKLAGIVIDGACRDVDMISKIKLPFYAKAIYARAGARQVLGKTQVTVKFGGVIVRAGDIIVGDSDGVVVIDVHDLEEVVRLAEVRRENEKVVLRKMKQGISLLDMLNLDEHFANIRKGKKSKLVLNPQK